jgi:hypothetical protein
MVVVVGGAAWVSGGGTSAHGDGPQDGGWISLFNGRDLSGWEACVARRPGQPEALVGRDPIGMFKVVEVDGEPAIRVSGDGLGGLSTRQEYGNYHLEMEFKWGEKRFPPRVNEPRDSGVLYHGLSEYNPETGWLDSAEFGLLEGGETGDFWSVPGTHGMRVTVDIEGEPIPPERRRYPQQAIRWKPDGRRYVGIVDGLLNGDDNEKPRSTWNKIDLICVGQTAVHVVNGTPNLVLTNIRRNVGGEMEPMTRGRVQLQSEGAEVYYRRIRLRPIEAIPAEIQRALDRPPPNTLSETERAGGWRLLFDGETTKGWRGYRKASVPDGWKVEAGALTRVEKAGDLITEEQFGDFELTLDWKVGHGSNSGIFYRATEEDEHIYQTAPEYEIRDSAFWTDNPYTNGANYALHPPTRDAARPVGYWNEARIVLRGNAVEHWLNGEKVVAYELRSDDWTKRVMASHVRDWEGYGRAARGHIGLQDYNDLLWFRNIKLRPLPSGPREAGP